MAWWWANILQIFIFGWTIPVQQKNIWIAQPLIENGAVGHILDSYEQNMRLSPHFMLPVFGISIFYLLQAFFFWLSGDGLNGAALFMTTITWPTLAGPLA